MKNYRAKYGHEPDIYAAHAYDALRLTLETFREAKGYSSSEIRKTLQFAIKEFPGVTGSIQFDDYGDVRHNPIMFIIKDGQVKPYEKYLKELRAQIGKKIRETMDS